MKDDNSREPTSTLEEICQKALDLDPAQRREFLDATCGQDTALRRDAESLLAHEHAAEQFLTAPAYLRWDDSGGDDDSLIGSRIGPYEVLSRLGSGGMANVYRARDTRLGRDVALKRPVVDPLAIPGRRARFEHEARLLASLNHPHIGAIYDIAEVEGSVLLVLELVEGTTLAQHLEHAGTGQGTLPLTELLGLARQIGDAVHAAHRKGIVHGDLKPANIVVTPEGTAKVLDFGIGRFAFDDVHSEAVESLHDSEHERGWHGLAVGTPSYMSPEQVRGTFDQRADIWAFGCVVYEMISGRQAFAAGPAAADTLTRVLFENPDWDALPNELPNAVRVVLRLCLEKDVDARLSTMREALALINRALEQIEPDPADGKNSEAHSARSIAVLPFSAENMGPDAAVFRDGIAEGIVRTLSQLPELTILAANTGRHYSKQWTRNPSLAAACGAGAVLTGRIRAGTDHFTVAVRLSSTVDGTQLWSAEYARASEALADIHEAIAADVRDWLGVRRRSMDGRASPSTPTVVSEAYRQYLKGRYAWNKRTTAGLRQALIYFEEAIRLDPTYALAFAAIADCHIQSPFYDRSLPGVSYRAAKTAAERALTLDPQLAEAHVAIGHLHLYYEWHWWAAEKALLRAIELAPGSSIAHQGYANYLSAVGKLDHALVECREALALDPVSLAVNLDVGVLFYFARRYDAAVEQLLTTIALDEHFASARAMLARVYLQSGRLVDARAAAEAAFANDDAPWVLATLGYTYALAGDIDAVRQIATTLDERQKEEPVSPYDVAILHGLIGDRDEAFRYLRAACDARANLLVWGLVNDPLLDGLRLDARFAELLQTANLPSAVS